MDEARGIMARGKRTSEDIADVLRLTGGSSSQETHTKEINRQTLQE